MLIIATSISASFKSPLLNSDAAYYYLNFFLATDANFGAFYEETRFEPLYQLLIWCFAQLPSGIAKYEYFQALFSFATMGMLWRALRYFPEDRCKVFFLIFLVASINFNFTITRMAGAFYLMAAGLIYLAIPRDSVARRSRGRHLGAAWVLLSAAALIHYATIPIALMLVGLLVLDRRTNVNQHAMLLIVLAMAGLASLVMPQALTLLGEGYYAGYIKDGASPKLRSIIEFALATTLYYATSSHKLRSSHYAKYLILAHIFFTTLSIAAPTATFLSRITYATLAGMMVALAELLIRRREPILWSVAVKGYAHVFFWYTVWGAMNYQKDEAYEIYNLMI
jgi:hypothetical protein